MRAVMLKDFNGPVLAMEDLPIPSLASGQVLVKIAAAPINPSDLIFLRNQYGVKKTLPVVPGFEGSGIVVKSNAGLYGQFLLGRRVACRAPVDGNGTWSEFMAVDAAGCVPLIPSVSLEQGASFLVNPLTAWALLTIARDEGHVALVQTAAASALGRMIARLARRRGIVCVNIVRRREQVELLKREGAVYALDSTQGGFREQLSTLCQRHEIRIAFDAVGGELTAQVAEAMPKGSRVLVYGALSGGPCQISALSLIFEGKKLEGFWLYPWIMQRSLLSRLRIALAAQSLLKNELRTDVQARFPLERVNEAITLYKEKRTGGKVLLTP